MQFCPVFTVVWFKGHKVRNADNSQYFIKFLLTEDQKNGKKTEFCLVREGIVNRNSHILCL